MSFFDRWSSVDTILHSLLTEPSLDELEPAGGLLGAVVLLWYRERYDEGLKQLDILAGDFIPEGVVDRLKAYLPSGST